MGQEIGPYRHKPRPLSELKDDLEMSRERLADLEARGDAACSKSDLLYGYNAEFNLRIVRNHISYYERQITEHPDAAQTALF